MLVIYLANIYVTGAVGVVVTRGGVYSTDILRCSVHDSFQHLGLAAANRPIFSLLHHVYVSLDESGDITKDHLATYVIGAVGYAVT